MTAIIRPRVWTQQPQFVTVVDWSNPLTRGLVFALTPHANLAGPGKVATPKGVAWSFDPAVPTPINTGISSPSVSSHSALVLVRHPSMSNTRSPNYLGTRVSSNSGWAFYQAEASGSLPDQTFRIGYVHGGIAGYTDPADIGGGNTSHLLVGFSATVSSSLKFYVEGKQHYSTALGGINNNNDTIRIGLDVYFSSQPADYELPFAAYWSRELSADEHAALYDNPWQIFRPRVT